jgi:TolB-like protein/Flp pilus assembly protein TadD
VTLSAGTRLGPYEILSPLGAGGMGEVYRARDSKLKRDVAIKVLPQSLAADADALARFEREALAVAALSHPNILSIFDFGSHEGTAYAVTELLEGETLSAKLASGRMPTKQAVDYAAQIVKGLAAAHEKGVIHRDLKPENLFVTRDGHLKILDFGLAKRVDVVAPGEETSAPTASGHTEPGTVIGTVGYMSPEQVRGLPLDRRTDIFSFGAILYEMLSGRRPFKRDTAADTMSAIMRDEPEELAGSGVSSGLDHVVRHCLEKDRDNRFQTARDVAFALSEASSQSSVRIAAAPPGRKGWSNAAMATGVLVVLAAAGLFIWRRANSSAPAPSRGVKRIAVLPFENLGAPEDDYFADGIADEIRSKLTSLPGIEVIARASSTTYKKTTKKPREIADELGVGYLLTATVRWQKGAGASRVHVTPELVEVPRTGAATSRWEQPFDAALTDVFQVQSDIASRVAEALGVALGATAKRLAEKPTQNLAAYEVFLKGEESRKSVYSTEGFRKALSFYEQAVALDPNFAAAWARLSATCSGIYFDDSRPEIKERAGFAGQQAAALAPDDALTYIALGRYQELVVWDNRRALELFTRGLSIAPGNAELLTLTGGAEDFLGRWEQAVAYFKRAQSVDPRLAGPANALGFVYLWHRRYAEARDAFSRALLLDPADPWVTADKIRTFLGAGDLAGARAVLRNAPRDVDLTALVRAFAVYDMVWVMEQPELDLFLRLTPTAFDNDKGWWNLAMAMGYERRGDEAKVRADAKAATKEFEEQVRAAPDVSTLHTLLGLALAYLGRRDDAIREGLRGVALMPATKDASWAPICESLLMRIYILVGEQDRALEGLERLLKVPGYLSPGWLKIDPNFDPLRKNPRFQKLVAGG